MSQCTHIIVFNHTQPLNLPSEIATFPQIHVVSELWLESCLRSRSLIDDTPYLLQPVNTEDGTSFQSEIESCSSCLFSAPNHSLHLWVGERHPRIGRQSLRGLHLRLFHRLFRFFLIAVLIGRTFGSSFFPIWTGTRFDSPFIASQEQFFLTCSVEKMGGRVLPFVQTLERTLEIYTQQSSPNALTHIICPYLRSGQRRRLQRCLGTYPAQILSSNWLYSCIDQYTCLSTSQLNPWDAQLFAPAVE